MAPSSLTVRALLGLASFVLSARALPVSTTPSPTLLSASAISAFTPYAYYASAGYCAPSTTIDWSCGASCEANPGFVPTASGGDGAIVQYWFVGYDQHLGAVVVSHQGTHPQAIVPLVTDANFVLAIPSPILFPSLPFGVLAHSGFLDTHAATASHVLTAVQATLSKYGSTTVITVGHSLGAAIALLDAVYLPMHLPSTISFKTYAFGLPRVGDPAFAAFVDSAASNVQLTHVNNMKDPVPILPPRILGFAHPAGEVHIQSVGMWYACAGEDNPSAVCEVGDTPTLLNSDLDNHDGPYGPVTMGCSSS